jgi:hypothetical protein
VEIPTRQRSAGPANRRDTRKGDGSLVARMARRLVSVALVVTGNPDIWIAAALAIAVYWKPTAAFVLLKPSVFPLALVGATEPRLVGGRRRLRGSESGAAAADAGLAHGYPQRAGRVRATVRLTYSVQDLPLLSVPLVAWAGSSRGVRTWLKQAPAGRDGRRTGIGRYPDDTPKLSGVGIRLRMP